MELLNSLLNCFRTTMWLLLKSIGLHFVFVSFHCFFFCFAAIVVGMQKAFQYQVKNSSSCAQPIDSSLIGVRVLLLLIKKIISIDLHALHHPLIQNMSAAASTSTSQLRIIKSSKHIQIDSNVWCKDYCEWTKMKIKANEM